MLLNGVWQARQSLLSALCPLLSVPGLMSRSGYAKVRAPRTRTDAIKTRNGFNCYLQFQKKNIEKIWIDVKRTRKATIGLCIALH